MIKFDMMQYNGQFHIWQMYNYEPINIFEQIPVRGSNFLVGVGTAIDKGNHWEISKGSALPKIPM